MLRCQSCNAEVGKNDRFCTVCGTKLPEPESKTGEKVFHVLRIFFTIFLLCGNWVKINLPQWLMHLCSVEDTAFSWFDVADVFGVIIRIGKYSGADIHAFIRLIPIVIVFFMSVLIIMFIIATIGISIGEKWGHTTLEKADGGFSMVWLLTALFVWVVNAIIEQKTNGLVTHLFSFTSTYHMVWLLVIAYIIIMPYLKRNVIKKFLFEIKQQLQQK